MLTRNRPSIGVVGCGYWGSKHVRVLHALDAVGEVVVVDERPERLLDLARSFPAVRCFPDLRSALPHLDAMVIATPPSTHASLALTAIEAGKHVLVEKPLATTSYDALRPIEAAAGASVVLMVGHTFEYNAAVWKFRDLIQAQELGEIYYIDSARLSLGLYQSDVNVIHDLAPHDISIINHVLGRTPMAVEAWASRHAHPRFEDVAFLRLYYGEGDLIANIHVSWLDPCKVRRITAVGSRKMAVYDDLATDERIRVHDKGVVCEPFGRDLSRPPASYRYGDVVSPYVAFEEPLLVQDRHFAECVSSGRRPRTDGQNGLTVVRALECAQRSLAERRAVLMDEIEPQLVGATMLECTG
jgi:predicted dehydrogenase